LAIGKFFDYWAIFYFGQFCWILCKVDLLWVRVARFFLVQNTKRGKIYQMTIKYFQWP
jgi:hypothetical protein